MREKYISSETGVDLTYEGSKFTGTGIEYPVDGEIIKNAGGVTDKTFQACKDISNLGGLIIRFQLGMSQRAGLITQVAREKYDDYAVDKVGDGADDTEFFYVSKDSPLVIQNTLKLQQLFSYPLGEAKILNRLTQPIRDKNVVVSGEQGLFGMMHMGVWQPILSLPRFLQKNNFTYVACPKDITPEEYDRIGTLLRSGDFKISEDGFTLTIDDRELDLLEPLKISIEPQSSDEKITFQANGLVVGTKRDREYAPLGWIMHSPTKKVLVQEDTEDLIRMIRLGIGGFHKLTPFEQKKLAAGRLVDNKKVRFTQNRQINAMASLFTMLEKEFDIDPRSLINNPLKSVAVNTKTLIERTNLLDDILTGVIQSEMVQHLMVTQPASSRKALPTVGSLDFPTVQNCTKAIAYAFDLKDGSGSSVLSLSPDEAPLYHDAKLPDIGIKGQLLMPSLTDSRHSAAILSTAILVAEQMIIEQLLDTEDETRHEALKSILVSCLGDKADGAYHHLVKLAAKCPRDDDKKPLLGLQFAHCAELIESLRTYIGTDHLIFFAEQLGTETHSSPEKIMANLPAHAMDAAAKSMKQLHLVCSKLQSIPGVSAAPVGSAGAVLGTSLLISKLFPSLAKDLDIKVAKGIKTSDKTLAPSSEPNKLTMMACPFMKDKSRTYNKPVAKMPRFFQKEEPTSRVSAKEETTEKKVETDNGSKSIYTLFSPSRFVDGVTGVVKSILNGFSSK